MTSRHAPLALALAAAFALGAACGNYSNEDLEFMNAVPAEGDLSADLPARSSALSPAGEAELSKATHDSIKTFNGTLDYLGAIEAIRAYQPTSRGPDSRIWGPIRDDNHAGWQWRFWMHRESDLSFNYAFELQPIGAAPDSWIPFLNGYFEPSPGVRRGVGAFHLQTAPLRAAGFPFDAEGLKVSTLDVSYSTKDYPVSVVVDLIMFPDVTDLTVTNAFHYEYGVQADGQGAMKFSVTGNFIMTTAAIETLTITSRWLASGAGRATATIAEGDGMGMTQTECWDDSFNATYNDKPWAMGENLGSVSACPAIPGL